MNDQAHAIETRFVHLRGRDIDYLVAGEGSPVVLLHGVGESPADWHPSMPALARDHRVYAPGLLRTNRNSEDADYSPAAYALDLAEFLRLLDLEQATVVGHSLGGLIALRMVLAQPGRVNGLVLIGSAGLGREVNPILPLTATPGTGEAAVAWSRTRIGAIQRAWSRAVLQFGRPSNVPRWWIDEQVRLAQQPGFLEATLASLRPLLDVRGQREVLLDQLPGLGVPVLVIWGERDRVFPSAHAMTARERLPHGQLALIPDAGHMPHVERPDAFLRELEPFLASLGSPDTAERA